ncbi:MAG: FAD-dependent oxidoreductase [Parasphingorhabdus sp.]
MAKLYRGKKLSTPYPHIFSPFSIGPVTLPNRMVMAPMSTELGGLDGEVSPQMIAFYRERALGGMGLIIVEYTCVEPETGRANSNQLTLESECNLDGHRRLVRAVHDAGARIFMQIQHGGIYANSKILSEGISVGPCDIFSRRDPSFKTSRALTSEEIEGLACSFGKTAALAMEAGYDGVELHGAHGYLLTQFLSPLCNMRDDKWGGDAERRLVFPLAVVRNVREAIGDAPLVFRISVEEFRSGGLTIDDMEPISQRLSQAGVDAFHCSAGWGVGAAFAKVIEPMSETEGWRIPYAARIRKATGKPVIAVGQIRWPETAEAAVADGQADLIALGRPMLADPEWANKAKAGKRELIRPCTSCNWCISPHEGRVQVGCAENPRTGNELDPVLPSQTGRGRRAVVVGAGPAGMSAALMLDAAGFETHLLERRQFLGGGLIASATPPGKDKLFWYRDYLQKRLSGSTIKLRLGQGASADAICALAPAITIVATGTAHKPMDITGLDSPSVVDAYDVLMGEQSCGLTKGQQAIVYGGGETGCEMAEFLAEGGIDVALITRSRADQLARSAEFVHRGALTRRLAENPLVTIVDCSHVAHVGEGEVTLRGEDGLERIMPMDRLFMAQGRKPDDELAKNLMARGVVCTVIGDSARQGRIGDAVHMAYCAVQALAGEYSLIGNAGL